MLILGAFATMLGLAGLVVYVIDGRRSPANAAGADRPVEPPAEQEHDAPTCEGWWFVRTGDESNEGGEWMVVEVVEREIRHERGDYPALRVLLIGTGDEAQLDEFDRWVGPLIPSGVA